MARPLGEGVIQTWPLPISTQALAISDACAAHGVPLQVFMGMYNNESGLGTNPNTGPDGPFQMISGTRSTYHYPATATPNSTEFRAQANGAAHYLHDIYVDFIPSVKSWRNALAGYNAGAGHYQYPIAQAYAEKALTFQIPAVWKANLSGNFTGGVSGGPSTPGGTAGAGGTGTLLNDSSGFRVGDASNPDEDYWTAINRLCQDRYWYVFSDGETIYVADGPDLMKQDVAMTLDRVADAGSITHLEFTFDNTAWSYSATRHKRHRAQRRTALARVTSPVEGLADVVCKIDEVRAGDVIEFDNCGPGDGKWLIGDVRRSVFEVTSEITVVPALTPLSEGQLNPAHQNTNNLSAFSTNITLGGYTNPVGNWTPSRVDAGVDGTLAGPYVAPGASEILIADSHNAGWKGGGYIAGRFTDGKLKGKVWYVAEGVSPLVSPHTKVGAGTPVARTTTNPFNGINGNIETGWASPTIPALPLGFVGNKDDQGPIALAAGTSFNRFLIKLGAKPGHISGRGIGVRPGTLPPGYP